jgi:hypothetical protein
MILKHFTRLKNCIFYDVHPYCSVVRWRSADVSEEQVASILRVKEETKHETRMKQVPA